jgi:hypothetical protein
MKEEIKKENKKTIIPMTKPALINLKRLSEEVSLSVPFLRQLISAGIIKPIKVGARLVFDLNDVVRSLKKNSNYELTFLLIISNFELLLVCLKVV